MILIISYYLALTDLIANTYIFLDYSYQDEGLPGISWCQNRVK